MNKSKRSLLNATSSIALSVLGGLFALIVTRQVIIVYGSDFNGLNSTASQFISMLLLIEGGFTLATNVALFKPMAIGDNHSINRILSASAKIFNKIGFAFFIFGIVISYIYAHIIRTEISFYIVFIVFFMTIVSTTINLIFETKYRILLQSEQKEYIIDSINILTMIFAQLLILLVVKMKWNMLLIRFFSMMAVLLSSVLIIIYTRRTHKSLDFGAEPDFESISGTKDIFIQKFTSMVYSTIPIIFIAGSVGTVYASIYIVYNNVFRLLKNILYSFINAPRIGFGKLIAERERNYVHQVFIQYEFIVNLLLFTFLSTAAVLIMPFIKLYTSEISDASYYNWTIALLLILTTFFEIIHIPSGNIINMSGQFKVGRKIQTIASIVLVAAMFFGNLYFGFYGILTSILITAILLALLEIYHIHIKYFNESIIYIAKLLIPSVILCVVLTYIEIQILPEIESYFIFFVFGIVITIINFVLLVIANYIANRNILIEVMKRIQLIVETTRLRNR